MHVNCLGDLRRVVVRFVVMFVLGVVTTKHAARKHIIGGPIKSNLLSESIISLQGGAEEDTRTGLSKDRSYAKQQPLWRSSVYSRKIKLIPDQCPLLASQRLAVLAHNPERYQQTFQFPQHVRKEDTATTGHEEDK